MKELSAEEEQWLEVFAKYNPFFDDLLQFFFKNAFLSEKQYECLENEINRAEEDGNIILDKVDFRFLKELAEENPILRDILKKYQDDGFLDKLDFNTFINIKLELNPDFKKREIPKTKSENGLQRKKSNEDLYSKEYIYVLKLENNRWWIGKTKNPTSRINKHIYGKGSIWTRKNKVIATEELLEEVSLTDITLKYMKEYGWENVRGTCFSNMPEQYIPRKIKDYIFNLGGDFKMIFQSDNQDIVEEVKEKNSHIFDFREDNIEVKSQDQEFNEKHLVYVLRLENDKWWIGKTTNIKRTLKKIKNGEGSPWTIINRLKKLEELRENSDLKEVTLEYMRNYGWENVRGYAWSQWNMKNPPKELR